MNPGEFLELLWGEKPEEFLILIWTLQDKRSHWCREVDEAAAVVDACRHMDVYTGVGLSPADYGAHQRCPADKIAALAGQWADFDIRSEAHSAKALPGRVEDALKLIPSSLPPTLVVSTGNGAHGWWLYKEPLVFDSESERQQAADLAVRFQTMLRFNAANHGWAFDRLADLPRVLRVPGTNNYKNVAAPKPVEVYEHGGQRYNPSDIAEFLDEIGIPDSTAQEQITREWAERFKDTPLVVSRSAEMPEAMIKGWVETDLRFRNTWFRQRHDLKDQSQSGYDLALADFGVEAGLNDQQITDLIIHHRRLHRQRQRTRADYFERTLAKASKRNGGVATLPPDVTDGVPDSSAQNGSSSPAEEVAAEPPVAEPHQQVESCQDTPNDPLATKAALCEQLSKIFGVRILRLVKLTGSQPTYRMVLENADIEFPHVGKLIDQKSVRLAIAGALNLLIPKIKPKLWEQLAQTLLDALIEEDAGPENDLKGSMRLYLGQYLADTAFISSLDDQPSNAIRRPMIIDDQVAVNSTDLQMFVNKTFAQTYSVKAIASMLAALGAKSIRVQGRKIREQGRWLLPVDEFEPADYVVDGEEENHGG